MSEVNQNQRLKGVKIREEFKCPITHELFKDPYLALDGRTYEKNAIKTWLQSHMKSPITGETIDSLLVPNINLKSLIQDLINEGGAGLYAKDKCAFGRVIDVKPQLVLSLKCLGPPDSQIFSQTLQITRDGAVGGRAHHLLREFATAGQELLHFKDDFTVSRLHFEVIYASDKGKYEIRDVGSVGGTFIRLAGGHRKRLHPGMMILVGKHQFSVASITGPNVDEMFDADDLAEEMDTMALLQKPGSKDVAPASAAATNVHTLQLDAKEEDEKRGLATDGDDSKAAFAPSLSSQQPRSFCGTTENRHEAGAVDAKNAPSAAAAAASGGGRCTLTCFAPDQSPLQGRVFVVGARGATLGRMPTNDISFSLPLQASAALGAQQLPDSPVTLSNIVDIAVSAEHATVEYESATGHFYIRDGVSKPSTNGTWFRLSGPQQTSPMFPLDDGDEVLLGALRFQVWSSWTISEETVSSASSTA